MAAFEAPAFFPALDRRTDASVNSDTPHMGDPPHTPGPVSREQTGFENGSRPFVERLQVVLDALPDQAAILSLDGTIIQANQFWQKSVEQLDGFALAVGENCFSVFQGLAAEGDTDAAMILRKLAHLCSGELIHFNCEREGLSTFTGRKFKLICCAFGSGDQRNILVSVQEITELQHLKLQGQQFAERLLQAQDDERRRIARELHDSTSQLIACLGFNLLQLERTAEPGSAIPFVKECFEVVEHLQQEVRALSYLYHPPRFDGDGLKNALERLMTGVAKRSGFMVETWLDDIQGASPLIENTLYRVAQEALTNIHRHAHATHVRASLIEREETIHLRFEDDGVGLPSGSRTSLSQLGVGIAGMRERLQCLGGRLTMPKAIRGTVVIASLPRRAA